MDELSKEFSARNSRININHTLATLKTEQPISMIKLLNKLQQKLKKPQKCFCRLLQLEKSRNNLPVTPEKKFTP